MLCNLILKVHKTSHQLLAAIVNNQTCSQYANLFTYHYFDSWFKHLIPKDRIRLNVSIEYLTSYYLYTYTIQHCFPADTTTNIVQKLRDCISQNTTSSLVTLFSSKHSIKKEKNRKKCMQKKIVYPTKKYIKTEYFIHTKKVTMSIVHDKITIGMCGRTCAAAWLTPRVEHLGDCDGGWRGPQHHLAGSLVPPTRRIVHLGYTSRVRTREIKMYSKIFLVFYFFIFLFFILTKMWFWFFFLFKILLTNIYISFVKLVSSIYIFFSI